MDKFDIFAIVVISIILLLILTAILIKSNFINFITKFFVTNKKNKLIFYRTYEHSLDYSTETRFRKISIEKLIKRFKKHTTMSGEVNVLLKFNKYYYPFYDLDDNNNLQLFKKIYSATPYVLFKSSEDHYWGIVDLPTKKMKDIFEEPNWNICNDKDYVSFCKYHKLITVRGLYETFDRKPILVNINKILPKNFQLFVDNLVTYYSKESLEMSVLRYQNEEMLIRFNRKRKLELLNARKE